MDNSNDNKVDVNTDLDDCSNKKRFSLKYLADELMKNRVKYAYTVLLLANYIAVGNSVHVASEAMVDVKFLLRTDMVKLNYGTSIGAIGLLVGCFSTFLYKHINRQLSLAVLGATFGIFIALIPLSQNLWHFYCISFMGSIGSGGVVSSSPTWIIEMWGQRASTVLHLQQLMYGIGSIIGPFIVGPYLVGDLSNKTENSGGDYTTTTTDSIITTEVDINYTIDRRAKLIPPHVISGVIQIIVPVLLVVMFVISKYKVPQTSSAETIIKAENEEKGTKFSRKTRIVLILLFSLSMTAYQALEVTFILFGPTFFQYIPIHMSATKAAKMTSILSTTYTVGRAVSALISSKVKASVMLSYHMVILGISLVILYFGQRNETILYIAMVTLGFGYSAMQPSYYSFADNTIKMTDRIAGIFTMSSVFFVIISPFIIAPSIEKHPVIVLYLLFGSFIVVVIIFILIILIVRMSTKHRVL